MNEQESRNPRTETYEEIEIEVIIFGSEDVITGSNDEDETDRD